MHEEEMDAYVRLQKEWPKELAKNDFRIFLSFYACLKILSRLLEAFGIEWKLLSRLKLSTILERE
ncbi:hypothetical protein EMU01_30930 [Enterococcus mundtii]|uniref:Uncharacterized protein n=1 Tax=Enterococcus mundtii TaxID=53346 RepID=A0ABQ0VGX4_ENTMU|nr:hypothetical protein EMU01_30930 [Enterococcus mundtii]